MVEGGEAEDDVAGTDSFGRHAELHGSFLGHRVPSGLLLRAHLRLVGALPRLPLDASDEYGLMVL